MPDAMLMELDRPLQELVERELAPGEHLVWARQPIPRWFTAASVGPMLVAIPFTVFAIVWTLLATGTMHGTSGRAPTRPAPAFIEWFFPLWGLMFVAIGLVMLTTPLRARAALERSVYVITDRRAIVLRRRGAFGSTSVLSYAPAALAEIERRERADGSGDLILETVRRRTNRNSASTTYRGFMSVPDVREAEATLRRTLLDVRL